MRNERDRIDNAKQETKRQQTKDPNNLQQYLLLGRKAQQLFKDIPSVQLACGTPSCLWRPKIPRKIKIFAWLLTHERLLTRVYRTKWRGEANTMCPLCGEAPETILHLFCECSMARALWRVVGAATSLHTFDSPQEMWEAGADLRARSAPGHV
ncbi:putative ribonuclease H protein [Acorus calamus]|uniref:Ribonuclease H protein n=1 Tax=Acorus calamus TaxID=4465 RepID=A0AAV9E8F7_ACOCL|nr:putative ribonuclease H protein [Acorus calamus]